MTGAQKFWLYLYSTTNIIATTLGILGLCIFFSLNIWSNGAFLWLLAVVPALYLVGYLLTPQSRTETLVFEHEATIDEIEAELKNLLKKIKGKVPKEIFEKVEHIQAYIKDILPFIVDVNSADHNIYVIRQTALEYLPETLENYLNLPRAYASLHPIQNGKTAKQVLVEQLGILEREMEEIAQDFHRNDSQKLLAHGRFLKDKFHQQQFLTG